MLPILEQQAKERQATSTGGVNPQLTAKLPEADSGESREHAARAVGVAARYVSDAKHIRVHTGATTSTVTPSFLRLSV